MTNNDSSTVKATISAGLGIMTWWSLRDVDVPRADLRRVFESLGLDKAVPRDPRPSAVLARACREALVGRSGDWQFDRVRDDADAVTAALSVRTVDAKTESVAYKQAATIRVEKATGNIVTDYLPAEQAQSAAAASILMDVKARFAHVTTNATTEDLRACLTNAMRGRRRDLLLGAVEINGVFFVRENTRNKVQVLQSWVAARNFGEITVLTVADDTTSRAQVAAGTTATIESRVRELIEEATTIAERVRTADEEDVDRILGPYLDRFALAEDAADLYVDVLGNAAEKLRAAITAARAEFAKRVTGEA